MLPGEGIHSAFFHGPDGQLFEIEALWPELLPKVPRAIAPGDTPVDLRQQITFIYTDDLAASESLQVHKQPAFACDLLARAGSVPRDLVPKLVCSERLRVLMDDGSYRDVMGLALVGSEDTPGGMRLFQVSQSGLLGINDRKDRPRGTPGVCFTFLCPDVDAEYERLLAKGVTFRTPPRYNIAGAGGEGEHKSAFFYEPSGCLLECQTFTDPAWPSPVRSEGVAHTPRAVAADMGDLTDPGPLNAGSGTGTTAKV